MRDTRGVTVRKITFFKTAQFVDVFALNNPIEISELDGLGFIVKVTTISQVLQILPEVV